MPAFAIAVSKDPRTSTTFAEESASEFKHPVLGRTRLFYHRIHCISISDVLHSQAMSWGSSEEQLETYSDDADRLAAERFNLCDHLVDAGLVGGYIVDRHVISILCQANCDGSTDAASAARDEGDLADDRLCGHSGGVCVSRVLALLGL